MDAWNKGTHGRSGLIDRVKASTVDEAQAEAQVIDFLRAATCRRARSPMCGNSICQDRRFLAKHMPKLEAFFHYRNLDVSTLKELARRWKPEILAGFKKEQAHTALADIHESIDELALLPRALLLSAARATSHVILGENPELAAIMRVRPALIATADSFIPSDRPRVQAAVAAAAPGAPARRERSAAMPSLDAISAAASTHAAGAAGVLPLRL